MIIKNNIPSKFSGCDSVVILDGRVENAPVKLLQLTDMQFIDSAQRRKDDLLPITEINAWETENFDLQCGNQIKSLVAQSHPDVIFITGDLIYGQFDDSGLFFSKLCALLDSFEIPWAPVFGNHDNESKKGVIWQCDTLEKSKYCLFKRGSVSGNGNYVVGIANQDKLLYIMYMLDSNGCANSDDPAVIKQSGIYPDQIAFIKTRAAEIEKAQGGKIPSIIAFHIPTDDFAEAEQAKGYVTEERKFYTIGVDVSAKDGDFGCNYEAFKVGTIHVDGFREVLASINAKGVFVGHYHGINTSILYNGIKWTFGLKTGQYDYHNAGQLGGTLVTCKGVNLEINHLCALAQLAPYPDEGIFNNLENLFVKVDKN